MPGPGKNGGDDDANEIERKWFLKHVTVRAMNNETTHKTEDETMMNFIRENMSIIGGIMCVGAFLFVLANAWTGRKEKENEMLRMLNAIFEWITNNPLTFWAAVAIFIVGVLLLNFELSPADESAETPAAALTKKGEAVTLDMLETKEYNGKKFFTITWGGKIKKPYSTWFLAEHVETVGDTVVITAKTTIPGGKDVYGGDTTCSPRDDATRILGKYLFIEVPGFGKERAKVLNKNPIFKLSPRMQYREVVAIPHGDSQEGPLLLRIDPDLLVLSAKEFQELPADYHGYINVEEKENILFPVKAAGSDTNMFSIEDYFEIIGILGSSQDPDSQLTDFENGDVWLLLKYQGLYRPRVFILRLQNKCQKQTELQKTMAHLEKLFELGGFLDGSGRPVTKPTGFFLYIEKENSSMNWGIMNAPYSEHSIIPERFRKDSVVLTVNESESNASIIYAQTFSKKSKGRLVIGIETCEGLSSDECKFNVRIIEKKNIKNRPALEKQLPDCSMIRFPPIESGIEWGIDPPNKDPSVLNIVDPQTVPIHIVVE